MITAHRPISADPGLFAQIVGAENVVSLPPGFFASPCREVAPATVFEACEVLRLAACEGLAVVPAGAGTWLDVGNQLRRADVILSTKRMQRIMEHEPADLIATAEAGVTLRTLNAELGRAGQWLALDPPDDGRATIGGVVATGLGGAEGYGYGAPRASVTGMRVALADGRIIKAGGRVVKNVAGYDLCKLFTGSYGTLCLILELTFKLRPKPARTATIVAWGKPHSLLRSAREVLKARLLPVAVELLSQSVAERLSLPNTGTHPALLIRYAGMPETVSYQTRQTINLLCHDKEIADYSVLDDDAEYWRGLSALPLGEADKLIWRANLLPGELGTFLERAMKEGGSALSSSSLWQAGVADGRLRVMDAANEDAALCIAQIERLRADARAIGGSLVIEKAPPEIKSSIDAWGVPESTLSLMRRLKKELDLNQTFSPGRFGAGL